MATDTIHVVIAYRVDGRGKLLGEPPLQFKSAAEATARAQRMPGSFAGVVAFSQTYDADTEQAEETPTVLFRNGRLPPEFDE